MFSLSDRLPDYLLGKYQIVQTVTVTALFSIVFILVSIPFSHNAWFELGTGESFVFTVAFFLISLFVVVVSKKIMYETGTSLQLTYLRYIIWNAAEVVVISLLYAFFTIEGEMMGFLDLERMDFEDVFLSSIVYVLTSLGVPYVVMAMYFALEDKNKTIRLMNLDSVVTDEPPISLEERRITLFDNSGVLKFVISPSNLYYIESDDNYIQVWYMDSAGVMKQYMVRCRLKTVEDSFAGSELIRCHRKYIININKVDVLSAGKDGYTVDLGIENLDPIPVSKTYEQAVLARFNSR